VTAAAILATAGVACARKPPDPHALVRQMSDRLGAAQAFSFSTSETHQSRRPNGKTAEEVFSRDLVARRPNAAAFTTSGPDRDARGVYDGTHLTLVWPGAKRWARVKMPPTIDEALDVAAEKLAMPLPVGDLLYSSVYSALIGPETKLVYGGKESVDGVECHRISATGERVEWKAWLAAEDDPLPLRLELTQTDESGPLVTSIVLKNWNLSASLAPDAFDPKVPEGYERIAMLRFEGEADASPAPEAAPTASGDAAKQ
jgi:hypothetical protein